MRGEGQARLSSATSHTCRRTCSPPRRSRRILKNPTAPSRKRSASSDKTVAKARKATAEKSAVAKRIGRDGKARKLPTKRMTPEAAEAMKARAEAVARLFPPPVKTIPEAARAEFIAALRMLAKSRDTAARTCRAATRSPQSRLVRFVGAVR